MFPLSLTKVISLAGVMSCLVVGATVKAGQAETAVSSDISESRLSAGSDVVATGSAQGNIQVLGQVPQRDQIKQGYLVFSEVEGQVVGAYYQPHSEFTCFVGSLENQELSVDFLSPEGQTLSSTSIALPSLHDFDDISANDQRMLNVCRQETAQSSMNSTL